MLTRRLFCRCLPLAAVATFAATQSQAQTSDCAVFTPERQKEVTPDEAIALLKAGNQRFVDGKTINCDLMAQVKQTAGGQAPFAAIVGCMDSRVPPELVFDQRIGDIFCARVAGNVINDDIVGSMEYATQVVGSRAIVVLGHSECGAVKGAIDDVHLGKLTGLLARIEPAVKAAADGGKHSSKDKRLVQTVAETNARMGIEDLLSQSSILKDLTDKGELRIVAAMHDVATGQVNFLTPA
jgi:carbonic anhydrase